MSDKQAQQKPTYAQVAASPPHSEDGNNSDGENHGKDQPQRSVVVPEGGAFLSKEQKMPADAGGKSRDYSASSNGSEPELINVDTPPNPPSTDTEMGGNSNKTTTDEPNKGKEQKKPEPADDVKDNVIEEFIPMKRTSMLTEEEAKEFVDVDERLKVLSNEMENKRRKRKHAAIIIAVGIIAGLAISGVVYWRVRSSRR